jgi:hypothetical protein
MLKTMTPMKHRFNVWGCGSCSFEDRDKVIFIKIGILCIVFHALYSMLCIICKVCYALYSVHYFLCIELYALYSMYYIQCIALYVLFSLHCIIIHCNLYILFYALYSTHCILCELLNFESCCGQTDIVMYKPAIAAKTVTKALLNLSWAKFHFKNGLCPTHFQKKIEQGFRPSPTGRQTMDIVTWIATIPAKTFCFAQ